MQLERNSLLRYCTVVLVALSTQAGTSARQQAGPEPAVQLTPGDAEFMVFVNGVVRGREQVRVVRSGNTWIVSSSGSMGAGGATSRFEAKYTADLHPIDSRLELKQGTRSLVVATSYGGTTAINEITQDGTTTSKTDQISARTVVLPNNFYASYEVLAARLAGLQPPADIAAYITPQAEIRLAVKAITTEDVAGPSGVIATRRYDVAFQNPGGALEATITIDGSGRFARLEIPSVGLGVVRSDLATVATRKQPARNPTDVDVTIPAAGFSLAGTLTTPPVMGRLKHPAVVLVAGSGPVDRDETVAGIPIFAQLAGALADRGFIVLRYDKRGVGQSGGRTERVTLQDYADDLVAAVKWLDRRRDVDDKRIAVAGHSEGASVGMLAAAREKKIFSLILMAGMGTTGAELILEQQRHVLDVMKASEADRQAKIELQKRLQEAAVTEKWEEVDEALRKQADSPWFRSLLLFDPAKVMQKVKQPILIVQGDLDTQVAAHHADTLGELARGRKKSPPVEVVHLAGVNHLLARATTGEVSEYGSLPEKKIVPEVADTIAGWLKK
jgi:alpha-beta hydrolase superfamily lysophospholipase